MDLGLQNKVIVVSGGGSGIGQAITRGALREGAKVAVITRITEAVEQFRQWVHSTGADCLILEAELADWKQCQAAIHTVLQHYSSIDALVNNAGANDGVGLENGSPEAFSSSLQQNLLHYYALAHFALPSLKAARGAIVNISSRVAVTGQGGTSAYAAAKGAQLALTREWAVELAPYGVRVNSILPAEVMTPLYQSWIQTFPNASQKLEDISANIPLGHRFTTPEEIAAATLFLLSPTSSSHTTGQHLAVDGGYIHLDRSIT